jgi:hypothetical protein
LRNFFCGQQLIRTIPTNVNFVDICRNKHDIIRFYRNASVYVSKDFCVEINSP